MRRLRILEKEELIFRIRGLKDNSLAWSLSAYGARSCGYNSPPRGFNLHTLDHDVAVTDARIVLDKLGLGKDFISERDLKQKITGQSGVRHANQSVIADGIFFGKENGKLISIAMEVELNHKSASRHYKVLARYAHMTNISIIWYLIPTKGLGDSIYRRWHSLSKFKDSPRLALSYYSEFLRDKGNARVYFGGGETKKFCELVDVQQEPISPVQSVNSGTEQVDPDLKSINTEEEKKKQMNEAS